MTARDVIAISYIEKTKVSRAIAVLESAVMLTRTTRQRDPRVEILFLTHNGRVVFADLDQLAITYVTSWRKQLGPSQAANLKAHLRALELLSRVQK